MKAYYQVAITKESVGSATRFKEPHLEGRSIIKVMDRTTDGESKLIVMECSEQEHQFNLARPGVVEVSETDATTLAAKYQPKHEKTEFQMFGGKAEKIHVPAFDLKGFMEQNEQRKNTQINANKTSAGVSARAGSGRKPAGSK